MQHAPLVEARWTPETLLALFEDGYKADELIRTHLYTATTVQTSWIR